MEMKSSITIKTEVELQVDYRYISSSNDIFTGGVSVDGWYLGPNGDLAVTLKHNNKEAISQACIADIQKQLDESKRKIAEIDI